MVTRRDFLRGTIGGLVGTLLPRISNASCRGLALEFYVQQVKDDIVSDAFYKGNLQRRKEIIEEIATPAQELFGLAGIPVTVHSFNEFAYTMVAKGDRISVRYGTYEQFLNEGYPTIEDLFDFLMLILPDNNYEGVENLRRQYVASEDPVTFEKGLRILIRDEFLKRLDGVTDHHKKQIGLFSGRWEEIQTDYPKKENLFIYERLYGQTLAHELGHICGLQHAERKGNEKRVTLPSGDENIMAKGDDLDISDFLDMHYNFSTGDRKILEAAQCSEE